MTKRMRSTPTLLITLLLAACNFPVPPTIAQAGPQSWIDSPLDGSQLPLAPVNMISHSGDSAGIAQVEFSVNGVVISANAAPDTTKTLLTMKQPWTPQAPGSYTLRVRAQNAPGVWGDYAQAVVTVAGESASTQPIVTPETTTPVPTETPAPPRAASPTATPTETSTQTSTAIPTDTPAPTATPYILFGADATIVRGECAPLNWSTANVRAVELDGTSVAGSSSTVVCPAATTVYTLSAILLDGATTTRQVTITVIPPSPTPLPTPTPGDVTGPSFNRLMASSAVFYRAGCDPASITVTANISDPSGVANALLWYRVGASGPYTGAAMDWLAGDDYRVTVNGVDVPGSNYGVWEFYVTAQDGAGNPGQSALNTDVSLNLCFFIVP